MSAYAIVVLLFLLVVLLAIRLYLDLRSHHFPLLTSDFQSVTLRNGEVYFGRIHFLGSDRPVLRRACKVRVIRNPSASEETYVIDWLRDEMDGADHLILIANSILFVKPVRSRTALGKAIERAAEKRTYR